jgi:hypothetical protein
VEQFLEVEMMEENGLDKQRKSSMGGYLSKRYTKYQGEDDRTKRSRSNIRSRLQQSYDTPLSMSK